jgi:hypothetical protein
MDIYDSESKGVRAQARQDQSGFIILAGSEAVGDSSVQSSLSEKPGRVETRRQLIRDGRLRAEGSKYVFTSDVPFNSPSEAASIIWGSNLNGRKVFGLDDVVTSTHVLHFEIDSSCAIEGYKKDQQLYVAERDRAIVAQRKELDGFKCQACGFHFAIGGKHVVECHHLDPIRLGQRETRLEDLVSLCPTCHRIAHMREPMYAISELQQMRQSRDA